MSRNHVSSITHVVTARGNDTVKDRGVEGKLSVVSKGFVAGLQLANDVLVLVHGAKDPESIII